MEGHITSVGFEDNVRRSLRYEHGFDHKDLERVKGLFDASLEHVGSNHLTVGNYEKAKKFMREHEAGKHFSDHQWERVDAAFKKHLGIKEEEAEMA